MTPDARRPGHGSDTGAQACVGGEVFSRDRSFYNLPGYNLNRIGVFYVLFGGGTSHWKLENPNFR